LILDHSNLINNTFIFSEDEFVPSKFFGT